MAVAIGQLGLLVLASWGALAGAAPVYAQETNSPEAGAGSAEIVVTAQRRTERQVDVPLSLSVLSNESLTSAGVTATQGLTQVTPGLQYAMTGILTQPTIRGIGTTGTTLGDSANVATYVDGVYQATMYGGVFELNNINRIEVLKGPQGTLFGRNATGGAILIHTREPRVEPSIEASVGYGTFNDRWVKGYVTGGQGDVSANVAAVYREDDGYIQDIYRNEKTGQRRTISVMAKIKYEPTSQTKVVLAGNYSDLLDNSVIAPYFLLDNSRSAFQDPTLPYARKPGTTALSLSPFSKVKVSGGSLTAQHDTGGITLKSLTSYQYVDMQNLTDLDGGPLPIQKIFFHVRDSSYSEELTIASSGTRKFSWVGGVFLFKDSVDQPQYIINDAPLVDARVLTKALGVFGEINAQLTDRLAVIGGLRYSLESKQLTTLGLTPPSPLGVLRLYKKWESFTPRVSLRYQLADRVNVYATYSKGFKSGAYNSSSYPTNVSTVAAVDPEKVTAYEAGVKIARTAWAFNAAVYHYDYDNIQVSSFVGAVGAITRLQNAASAKITGVDGDFSFSVSDRLRLTAGASYSHARYNSFPGAISLTPAPNRNGNIQSNVDASGNAMVRQPNYTLNLGATYTMSIGLSQIELSGNTYFSGSFYWDAANTVKEPAYNVTNLRATWIMPGDRVRISVIGNNVFDTRYNQVIAIATAGTRAVAARPATIAAEVRVKF